MAFTANLTGTVLDAATIKSNVTLTAHVHLGRAKVLWYGKHLTAPNESALRARIEREIAKLSATTVAPWAWPDRSTR